MQAFKLQSAEQLRDFLATDYKLYQVVADENNNAHWEEANEETKPEVITEPLLPQTSTKSLLFSERESLFNFDGEKFVATIPAGEKKVFFGVRACDLVAIGYQDKFFKADPYYQARRRDTLLVGMDCVKPCANGFCSAVDAGPAVRENTADLILVPPVEPAIISAADKEKNQWFLVVGSEQGLEALNGLALEKADDNWQQVRQAIEAETIAAFGDQGVFADGIAKINQNKVEPEVWQAAGIQCLTCSGCSNVCPTCSCYATRDVGSDINGSGMAAERTASVTVKAIKSAAQSEFTRERFWDSCLYEGFQKEASGNNPAEAAGQRVARFWYHKFSEDFVKDFGRYGCVGCGRCDQVCPGVIGAKSIMTTIANDSHAKNESAKRIESVFEP